MLASPLDKVNFFSFQVCRFCGKTHFGFSPEGSDVYPIVNSECPSCGKRGCFQQGPPITTLN